MLSLLAALVVAGSVDVASAFERLNASSVAERAAAERELTRELAPGDYAALRDRAAGGDAEVRRRLVFALAGEDRHLGLAARLACEREGQLATLGREAIAELIARWSAGYARIGLGRTETLAKLREKGRYDRPIVLETRGVDDLEALLDRIAREVPGVPTLVLDPDLALETTREDAPATIEGVFDRALAELVRTRRLGLESFGQDDDLEGRARPWIRIARRGTEAQRTGTEHWTEWVAGASCASSPDRRSACARALAATGWPAAIAWLDERWRSTRDESVLDALLLAAARGRVASGFESPAGQLDLVERRTRAAAEGTSRGALRADRIARTLALVLALDRTAGEALDRGWPAFSARDASDWLLVVGRHGSPELPSRLASLLGDEARWRSLPAKIAALDARSPAASKLRLRALRAAAELEQGPTTETGARAFVPQISVRTLAIWLEAAHAGDDLDELVGRIVDQRVEITLEPALAEELVRFASDAARRAAVATIVFRETGAPGKALLRSLETASDRELEIEQQADRLLPLVRSHGDATLVRAVEDAREQLASGGGDLDPTSLDLLLVLAQAGGDEVQERVFERALAASPRRRIDLLALGALAAGSRGGEARDALVATVGAPGEVEPVIAALDRAIRALRAARKETEERAFVAAVRAAVREAEPLRRAALRVDAWPAAPEPDPIELRDARSP